MSKGLSRVRRAAVLAVALVLIPTAALALFRPTATATLTVGTATLAAPSNLSWSTGCPQGQTTGTVKLKGFTGVPRADGYTAQVSQDGVVLAEERLSDPSQKVDLLFTRTGSAVEVSVRAKLKSWTGTPATVTIVC